MKTIQFMVFYLIVLAVYVPLHYYLFTRFSQALPSAPPWRLVFKVIFIFLAAAYFGGRALERVWSSPVSDVIIWIGSFWLAVFVYGLIIVLLIDLVRLLDYLIPFFPTGWVANPIKTKVILLGSSLMVIMALLVAGFINARTLRIKTLNLQIEKSAGHLRSMNVVLVSDLHLGHVVGKHHAGRIVEKINALDPDLILLAGDVIDEDISPVLRKDIGSVLGRLKADLGVYSIAGNHEYIGGIDSAEKYLSKYGIKMLRDQVAQVGEKIFLVGREDITGQRFTGKKRKELSALLADIDMSNPVILLDHQPFHLEHAAEQLVDVQLSGHTHGGQIWPFTYIVDAIYEIGTGYGVKGNTHYYVSPGAGTWGPPLRIGTIPEIVNLRLTFGE